MRIALLTVDLFLPWIQSLKEKRSIIQRIIHQISGRFRVSIVESDYQDLHQSAQLMMAMVVFSQSQGDSVMEQLLAATESLTEAEIIRVTKEYR